MATRTFSSRSRLPVARAPAGIVTTGRDSHFSWVMPEASRSMYQCGQGRSSGSLESLSESAETHKSSSSISSLDGSPVVARARRINLNAPHKDVPVSVEMGPQIVDADPNPPLRAKTLKGKLVHKPVTTATKPGSKAKPTPTSPSKSLVPSAFKFKRAKSTPPSSFSTDNAHGPALARAPSARSSLPIAARFAKANRASWIQKYGSVEATTGPIVPSSKPTLSFVNDLPGMADMPPSVPALPKPVKEPLHEESSCLERSFSPVVRAISPKPPATDIVVKRSVRTSPHLRVRSPSPNQDIPMTLQTPAAIRIMYPSPKPMPTMPLPQPPIDRSTTSHSSDVEQVRTTRQKASRPMNTITTNDQRIPSPPPRSMSPVSRLPQLPRTTTVVQLARAKSPSPISRSVTPLRTGSPVSTPSSQLVTSKRTTPTMVQSNTPAQSRHASLDRSRSPVMLPGSGRSTPLETSRTAPNIEHSAINISLVPASPLTVDGQSRRFIPAPPASSGLRRTPSLPPARRAETPDLLIGARRGREHPFPLRPVQRRYPGSSAYGGSVTDDEDEVKLARVGYYLPAASLSATDLASHSLHPPAVISRISEARSSVYSETREDDNRITLMTEEEHDARREKLINSIERLITRDGRVLV